MSATAEKETKKKVTLPSKPDGAFTDPAVPPFDDELRTALGRAYPMLERLLNALLITHPEVTHEWKFSPRSGWYRITLLKKRRLFYLAPKRGDFRFSLILGDKALADLAAGAHAAAVQELLKVAKRWPEGTEFRFNATTFDASLAFALLAAKIAH